MNYKRLPCLLVNINTPLSEIYHLNGGILYNTIVDDVKGVYDKNALDKDKCWKDMNEDELISEFKRCVSAFVKNRTYVGILDVLNICFIIATRIKKK